MENYWIHQGGYTPFSFELTEHLTYGKSQKLVVRVDDKRRDFTLYGKTRLWKRTRYLANCVCRNRRGKDFIEVIHFAPDIDNQQTKITAYLPTEATADTKLSVAIKTEGAPSQKKSSSRKEKISMFLL